MREKGEKTMAAESVVLDKDYSLTADGKPVAPDDPAAATVLGGKGSVISREQAEKLGLSGLEEHKPYHPNAEEWAAAERGETPATELDRLRKEVAELRAQKGGESGEAADEGKKGKK